MAGVYANFANVTFTQYEFSVTFARVDHEVEDRLAPGGGAVRGLRRRPVGRGLVATGDEVLRRRGDQVHEEEGRERGRGGGGVREPAAPPRRDGDEPGEREREEREPADGL